MKGVSEDVNHQFSRIVPPMMKLMKIFHSLLPAFSNITHPSVLESKCRTVSNQCHLLLGPRQQQGGHWYITINHILDLIWIKLVKFFPLRPPFVPRSHPGYRVALHCRVSFIASGPGKFLSSLVFHDLDTFE